MIILKILIFLNYYIIFQQMETNTQQKLKDVMHSITDSMNDDYLVLAFKLLKELDVNDPNVQRDIGNLLIEDIFKVMKTHKTEHSQSSVSANVSKHIDWNSAVSKDFQAKLSEQLKQLDSVESSQNANKSSFRKKGWKHLKQ
jgi:hypothetical protein